MNRTLRAVLAAATLAASHAYAQLAIEITGGGGNQIPIAIAQFAGEPQLQPGISDVVEADLARSGRFRTLYTPVAEPAAQRRFERRLRGLARPQRRCAGGRRHLPGGQADATRCASAFTTCRSRPRSAASRYTISREQARATAHRIADFIYEKLTGDKGVFSHPDRVRREARHPLRLRSPTPTAPMRRRCSTSNEPIMSPAWSPDGSRLAYVSFEQKKPIVYVQR